MELKIKGIGEGNSAAYGIFKFGNFANAGSFTGMARKPMVIVLGDDQLFWVVSLCRPMITNSVEERKQQVLNMKKAWVDAILNEQDTGDVSQKLGYNDFASILGAK